MEEPRMTRQQRSWGRQPREASGNSMTTATGKITTRAQWRARSKASVTGVIIVDYYRQLPNNQLGVVICYDPPGMVARCLQIKCRREALVRYQGRVSDRSGPAPGRPFNPQR